MQILPFTAVFAAACTFVLFPTFFSGKKPEVGKQNHYRFQYLFMHKKKLQVVVSKLLLRSLIGLLVIGGFSVQNNTNMQ